MTQEKHVCLHCSRPTYNSQRKFCSKRCHASSMKRKPRYCKQCGIEFKPIRSKSIFCSLDCFNKHRINSARASIKNPPSVEGACWIPLTQNKFALIDADNFDDISRFNWCAVKVRSNSYGDVFYAKRTDTPIYMHRYITNADMVGSEVDHLGDTLDNRRQNLRLSTRSQNQMNKRSYGGSSKYKGVSYAKATKKWASQVWANGSVYHLGYFDDEEKAAREYDKHARMYHGEFARLNFPGVNERSAL